MPLLREHEESAGLGIQQCNITSSVLSPSEEGISVVELVACPENAVELTADGEVCGSLSGILQHIPGIVSSSFSSTSKLVELTFSPKAAKALSNGAYQMVSAPGGGFRALAKDGLGRIRAQGTLSPATAMKSVAAIATIWQVLATITAQRFLSDINKRLARVQCSVRELADWLATEHRGQLVGRISYLRELSELLRSSTVTAFDREIVANQLEQVFRESNEAIEANRARMKGVFCSLRTHQSDGHSEENARSLLDLVHSYFDSLGYVLAFSQVQVMATHLRVLLPLDSRIAVFRLDLVMRRVRAMSREVEDALILARKKTSSMKGRFYETDAGLRLRRKRVREQIQMIQDRFGTLNREMQQSISHSIDAIVQQQRQAIKPQKLIVELGKDGTVAKVFQLNEQSSRASVRKKAA